MVLEFAHWFAWRHGNAERAHEDAPRILAIVPHGPDRRLLQAIARDSGWALAFAGTPPGNLSRCPGIPPIVICDRRLTPYNWREIVGMVTRESPKLNVIRPYVILFSPTVDRNLRDEMERVGGSDILRSPVNRDDLFWAVKRAWQFWRSQQKVYSPLPFSA